MRRTRPLVALTATFLALACSSSTDPGSDMPDGISVSLNGSVVVEGTGGDVEGAIHLHLGEESGRFIVEILNERGRALDLGPDVALQAVVGDPTKAAFAPPAAGAFEGGFEIFDDGETTITFRVLDQGSPIPLWTSPPIPLLIVVC